MTQKQTEITVKNIGVVRSKTGDKLVKVNEYKTPHPLIRKKLEETTVHVHDEQMILMLETK